MIRRYLWTALIITIQPHEGNIFIFNFKIQSLRHRESKYLSPIQLGSGKIRDLNPSLVLSPDHSSETLKTKNILPTKIYDSTLKKYIYMHIFFGNKLVLPSQKPIWNKNIKNHTVHIPFDPGILVLKIYPTGIIPRRWKIILMKRSIMTLFIIVKQWKESTVLIIERVKELITL